MVNRTKRYLSAIALCSLIAPYSQAEEKSPTLQVITPGVERAEIEPAATDTEDFFFEDNYGSSEGDITSYEKLSGGVPLYEDAERDYSLHKLNIGWNALPGQVFLFGGKALTSDIYLTGGDGSTDFLGDSWSTVTVGVGYRLLLNDWIAWRLDVRDHIFDRDTFGEDETTNNIELSTRFTFFF